MTTMGLTVAIATARETNHGRWPQWKELARRFARGDYHDMILNGEWGAWLLALQCGFQSLHVDVQLAALSMQTRWPDHVCVVHRSQEYEDRSITTGAFPAYWWAARKKGDLPLGNADKNQAIDACATSYMAMLDDFCIPSFAFCELACEACERGNVLLPQHWKLYLPKDTHAICVAKANMTAQHETFSPSEAKLLRRVGGIWAMPFEIASEVRYNEDLDGKHGLWDEEFLQRLDAELERRGACYEFHPRARVYEIEHDRPWADAGVHDPNTLRKLHGGTKEKEGDAA